MRNCIRKITYAAAAMMFSFSFSVTHAATESDIYGEWRPPDMDAVISIRNCGEILCAELVEHDYTALIEHDINNPDPALRNRALLGVRILDHLRKTGFLKWSNGELYDPRTGKIKNYWLCCAWFVQGIYLDTRRVMS